MFENEIDELKSQGLLRSLRTVESVEGVRAVVDGRQVMLFCSNDYLGLAGHPYVRAAAKAAIDKYGYGSGSAPLISGRTTLHARLEEDIASLKGTKSALVFGSGYLANTGIIPALAREGDLILSDSLNHASIIDGCRLSRAKLRVFGHCDVSDLETLLREASGFDRIWIITEGVFSMDGDIAPMPDIMRVANEYGARVILDDAHATGTTGGSGRGTLEQFGIDPEGVVQIGTLGKALGSYGAFVAADSQIIDWLVNSARSFMFSTALPPAACAAASAAIDTLVKEPQRTAHLKENHRRLRRTLLNAGFRLFGDDTPIIPVIVGNAEDAVKISGGLMEEGFFAPAIRPPTVPDGGSRVRFTVSALHTDQDIDSLVDTVKMVAGP